MIITVEITKAKVNHKITAFRVGKEITYYSNFKNIGRISGGLINALVRGEIKEKGKANESSKSV